MSWRQSGNSLSLSLLSLFYIDIFFSGCIFFFNSPAVGGVRARVNLVHHCGIFVYRLRLVQPKLLLFENRMETGAAVASAATQASPPTLPTPIQTQVCSSPAGPSGHQRHLAIAAGKYTFICQSINGCVHLFILGMLSQVEWAKWVNLDPDGWTAFSAVLGPSFGIWPAKPIKVRVQWLRHVRIRS